MSKSVNSPSSRNSWKPSRRNVLKGLGATAVATAAAPAIKVRADDEVNINILLTNIPWTDAVLSTIADAYNAHTGGRVTITGEQMPYEAHYEKIILELSSGSSTFDIVTSDTIWIRQLVNNNWVSWSTITGSRDSSR